MILFIHPHTHHVPTHPFRHLSVLATMAECQSVDDNFSPSTGCWVCEPSLCPMKSTGLAVALSLGCRLGSSGIFKSHYAQIISRPIKSENLEVRASHQFVIPPGESNENG